MPPPHAADRLAEPASDSLARQRWVTGSVALSVVLAIAVLGGASKGPPPEHQLAATRLDTKLTAWRLESTAPPPVRIVVDADATKQPPPSDVAPLVPSSTYIPLSNTTTAAPTPSAVMAPAPTEAASFVAPADVNTASPATRACWLPAWPRWLAVGDSHSTEFHGNALKKRRGQPSYVELLARAWEHRPLAGDAVAVQGGRTVFAYPGQPTRSIAEHATADVAAAVPHQNGSSFDACLLLAGTNDVLQRRPVSEFVRHMVALWQLCAGVAHVVVVQAVPPVHCFPSTVQGVRAEDYEKSRLTMNRCLVALISALRSGATVASCDGLTEGVIQIPLPERAVLDAAPCRQTALFHTEDIALQLPAEVGPVLGNASTYNRYFREPHAVASSTSRNRPTPGVATRRTEADLHHAYSDCVHFSVETRTAYAGALAQFLRPSSGAIAPQTV
jgi:hypothetical protein